MSTYEDYLDIMNLERQKKEVERVEDTAKQKVEEVIPDIPTVIPRSVIERDYEPSKTEKVVEKVITVEREEGVPIQPSSSWSTVEEGAERMMTQKEDIPLQPSSTWTTIEEEIIRKEQAKDDIKKPVSTVEEPLGVMGLLEKTGFLGALEKEEEFFQGIKKGIREEALKAQSVAEEYKVKRDPVTAIGQALGSVGLRTGVGLLEAGSFVLRPKAWGEAVYGIVTLPSALATLGISSKARTELSKTVSETIKKDPLILAEAGGQLLGAVIVGKVGGRAIQEVKKMVSDTPIKIARAEDIAVKVAKTEEGIQYTTRTVEVATKKVPKTWSKHIKSEIDELSREIDEVAVLAKVEDVYTRGTLPDISDDIAKAIKEGETVSTKIGSQAYKEIEAGGTGVVARGREIGTGKTTPTIQVLDEPIGGLTKSGRTILSEAEKKMFEEGKLVEFGGYWEKEGVSRVLGLGDYDFEVIGGISRGGGAGLGDDASKFVSGALLKKGTLTTQELEIVKELSSGAKPIVKTVSEVSKPIYSLGIGGTTYAGIVAKQVKEEAKTQPYMFATGEKPRELTGGMYEAISGEAKTVLERPKERLEPFIPFDIENMIKPRPKYEKGEKITEVQPIVSYVDVGEDLFLTNIPRLGTSLEQPPRERDITRETPKVWDDVIFDQPWDFPKPVPPVETPDFPIPPPPTVTDFPPFEPPYLLGDLLGTSRKGVKGIKMKTGKKLGVTPVAEEWEVLRAFLGGK